MKITRTSTLSGITRSMEIPVTEQQLADWKNGKGLIQDVMPDLSNDEREFIMTGVTKEEWDAEFGEDDSSECIE